MIKKQYSSLNVKVGTAKKVEGDDRLAMIGEKCLPALMRLGRARLQASQIPGDGSFGDRKPEFQHLAMNLRRSPVGVLGPHLASETTDLVDPRSAPPPPRSSTPI